jgi:hypothetical protein
MGLTRQLSGACDVSLSLAFRHCCRYVERHTHAACTAFTVQHRYLVAISTLHCCTASVATRRDAQVAGLQPCRFHSVRMSCLTEPTGPNGALTLYAILGAVGSTAWAMKPT